MRLLLTILIMFSFPILRKKFFYIKPILVFCYSIGEIPERGDADYNISFIDNQIIFDEVE